MKKDSLTQRRDIAPNVIPVLLDARNVVKLKLSLKGLLVDGENLCCFREKPLFSRSIIPDNTDRVWFAEDTSKLIHAIELACYIADKVGNVEVTIKVIDDDFKDVNYREIINRIISANPLTHNIVFRN